MSKIYTKGGDQGETSLFGGTRILKSSKKVTAYGTVDQANASIGVASVNLGDSLLIDLLKVLQEKLFVVGGELASDKNGIDKLKEKITSQDIEFLEKVIDELSQQLTNKPYFIVPGANKEAAYLHLARTTVRQAERAIISLTEEQEVNPLIVIFMNRLSDLLFTMSRYVAELSRPQEIYQTDESLSLKLANTLATLSLEKASTMKVPVVISIVDAGGHLILLNKMENAHIGSIDISINKAFTAVAFKLSTEDLGKVSVPNASLYGIQHTNNGKIVIFGGGIPIYLKGKLVGAIGVSGGSVEEDILIAKEALKNLS